MSKIFASIAFVDGIAGSSQYTSDTGTLYDVTSRIQLPQDLDDINLANSIAFLLGGVVTKYKGETITAVNTLCSNADVINPRKLQFIRSNGNTISIIAPFRSDLINTATAIRSLINGAGSFPVVCIKLIGEESDNLNDLLLTKDEIGVSISGEPVAGGVGSNYSEFHQYNTDAIFGNTIIQAFKIRTDIASQLPTFLTPLVAGSCMGQPINVNSCGGSSNRTHRRYYLDMLTATRSQSRQVPVASHLANDILNCGSDLANLPGVYCIGYKGESNDRFHLLLDN